MSTGTVVEVRALEVGNGGGTRVEVLDGSDLQSQYERLVALTLRMGAWLAGSDAARLPREEWERQFERYQEHLERVRRLGDQLRPVTLRDRQELLAGDALRDEVLELFAA